MKIIKAIWNAMWDTIPPPIVAIPIILGVWLYLMFIRKNVIAIYLFGVMAIIVTLIGAYLLIKEFIENLKFYLKEK